MRNTRLDIGLLSGAGGAEISGVDVAEDLDDGTVAEIREALNEHCVVFFRDQALDVAQHKAFARRFGEIFIHPNYVGMSDDPEILMVRREPGDTTYVGEDWHADTTMWPLGADLGRRWAPSSTASTCHLTAATRCSPTRSSPTTRCRAA